MERGWFKVGEDRLRLLESGPERLEALIALIEGAKHSLRLLFYIYADDGSGRRVRDALVAAAERGVTVSLIVDGFGCAAPDGFFDALSDAGAAVCRFLPGFGRRQLLRNHQKLALADDARVITGGFNIEDSYFGSEADGAWRDLGLELEGPSAKRIGAYYDHLKDWAEGERKPIRVLRRLIRTASESAGATRWLLGGPTPRLSPWAKTVRDDMRAAKRVDMIAAYFAPGPGLLRRIDRAGRRAKVRLVTAAKSDNTATIAAARFTYRGLLNRGVEIYEYRPTKLHTKLYVIDNTVHLGSANFDMRSLFINLEIMVRIDDAVFAAHVRDYFETELESCDHITAARHRARTGPLTRIRQFGAYVVIAVLDYNLSRRLNFGLDGR